MGLDNFAPYLMNRIMGRYNAALSAEMAALGLTTPQMRSLAVLSVTDGILIRELAVYAVVQQSTPSRALDALVREAYARLWPHMAQAYEAMFKGIGPEEKAAFVATLQTMLRNIRKHDF